MGLPMSGLTLASPSVRPAAPAGDDRAHAPRGVDPRGDAAARAAPRRRRRSRSRRQAAAPADSARTILARPPAPATAPSLAPPSPSERVDEPPVSTRTETVSARTRALTPDASRRARLQPQRRDECGRSCSSPPARGPYRRKAR